MPATGTSSPPEDVWDYPRPAVAQPTGLHLRVVLGGVVIAETRRGVRVIETSHPPSYYFPPDDVLAGCLVPAAGATLCEWKGGARYFDVRAGGRIAARAAWAYPDPDPSFAILRDFVAFYPGSMEACSVDGERAIPQEGGFYGGWITSHVAGPFKGAPGTSHW